MTWMPWKPVAMKKVAPYAESEMVKDASQYSSACSDVKYSPSITVINSPCLVWEKFLSIIPWCAHVTVTPEAKRIIVFKRGTWKGLKGVTPAGGHWRPISIAGANLLWKKAQKKEKKNRTSDVIKRIIPQRSPLATIRVWRPWKAPSRLMSRHHWMQVKTRIAAPNVNRSILNVWNHFTMPVVIVRAAIAPVSGQGLWSTKWKAWLLFIVISVRWFLWRTGSKEQQIHKIELLRLRILALII